MSQNFPCIALIKPIAPVNPSSFMYFAGPLPYFLLSSATLYLSFILSRISILLIPIDSLPCPIGIISINLIFNLSFFASSIISKISSSFTPFCITVFIFVLIPAFIASFIPDITSFNASTPVIVLNFSFLRVSRLIFTLESPAFFKSLASFSR